MLGHVIAYVIGQYLSVLAFGPDPVLRIVASNGEVTFTRREISSVESRSNDLGTRSLDIRFQRGKAEEIMNLTNDVVGEKIEIYVCDQLVAEPLIHSPLSGTSVSVTGSDEILGDEAFAQLTSGYCDR